MTRPAITWSGRVRASASRGPGTSGASCSGGLLSREGDLGVILHGEAAIMGHHVLQKPPSCHFPTGLWTEQLLPVPPAEPVAILPRAYSSTRPLALCPTHSSTHPPARGSRRTGCTSPLTYPFTGLRPVCSPPPPVNVWTSASGPGAGHSQEGSSKGLRAKPFGSEGLCVNPD